MEKGVKRKKVVDASPSKKFKRYNTLDEFPTKNIINKGRENTFQNSRVDEKFENDEKKEEISSATTDDLIKILSEFNASCQKPAKQISTITSCITKSGSQVKNSKYFTSKNSKYRPRKKTMDLQGASREDLSDNTSNDCDWITDEEINETTLIIDESKKKRKPKISDIRVPDELMEMIVNSGIDDALEKKAEKRKLTATHVKNIIKHIVTDENVCQMIKNSILGLPEKESTFEPKLTRAKRKELYEKQLKEAGDLSSASLFICPNRDLNGVRASCLPGTSALITTEFPEEEDDEDYLPKCEEQFMSEEESELGHSKIGSSCSTPQSSIMMTPSSVLSITPKYFSNSPQTNLINRSCSKSQTRIIKRSLDFSKNNDEFERIGNRTRSKYSMTDTPIEYLEMQLKAPDVTPDLYYMGDDGEEYQNFLSNYVKPHDNNEDAFEDDEQVDPEYNLLQDVEFFNKNAIREEMRGDKGVRVSKKELNQLMDNFLDIFDEDLEEDNQHNHVAINHDIHELEANSLFENTKSKPHAIYDNSTSHCQIPRPSSPQETWEKSITVTYMIPQFSQQHIKVLKAQLAVHVQLLTTTVLNTNHKPCLNDIKLGAVKMLNNMVEEGQLSKPNGSSLFHPDNLQSAIETTTIFQDQKEKANSNNLRKDINDSYPCRFVCDSRYLERFPEYIKDIYMNSSAFIYPQYLPKGIFHGKLLKRRGRFRTSEYWLLACCFKELVSDFEQMQLKRLVKHPVGCNQDLYNLCQKVGKTGLFYATGRQIAQKMHTLLLGNNLYGQFEENPVINFFKTSILDLPQAQVIPPYNHYPCCIKEMNPSSLPNPFKLFVNKKLMEKVNNTVLEPYDPSSIKNILVIQDAFGTKIILPPQVLPKNCKDYDANCKETNSDLCFPSYSISLKLPVSSGVLENQPCQNVIYPTHSSKYISSNNSCFIPSLDKSISNAETASIINFCDYKGISCNTNSRNDDSINNAMSCENDKLGDQSVNSIPFSTVDGSPSISSTPSFFSNNNKKYIYSKDSIKKKSNNLKKNIVRTKETCNGERDEHSMLQNDMLFQAMLDASIMDGIECTTIQNDDLSDRKEEKNLYILNHLNSNSPDKCNFSGILANSTKIYQNSDNNEIENSHSDLPIKLAETVTCNSNKNKIAESLKFSKTLTNILNTSEYSASSNSLDERTQLKTTVEKVDEFSLCTASPKKDKFQCLHLSSKSNISEKFVDSSAFTEKFNLTNIPPVKMNRPVLHCKTNCSKPMLDQENVLSLTSVQRETNDSKKNCDSMSLIIPNFHETEICSSRPILNNSHSNYNSQEKCNSLTTFFDNPINSMLQSVGSLSEKKNEYANLLAQDPKFNLSLNKTCLATYNKINIETDKELLEKDCSWQTEKERKNEDHFKIGEDAKKVSKVILESNSLKQSNNISISDVKLKTSPFYKKKIKNTTQNFNMGKIKRRKEAGKEPMVLNYILRVKEILDNCSEGRKQFDLFVSILQQFQRSPSNLKSLYSKIIKIFGSHSDLADEFTMFLSSSQAKIVGKSIECKIMKNTRAFIKDLESIMQVDQMSLCINIVKQLFCDPQTNTEKVWASLGHLVNCKRSFSFLVRKHFSEYPKFVS